MGNVDGGRKQPVLSEGAPSTLAKRSTARRRESVVTAGYPCQPHSTAARGRNRAELDLWPHTLHVIHCERPRWVVLENVPGYGLDHIERSCRDLEGIGYSTWPIDIGVEIRNHVRRRIWVVAHADSEGKPQCPEYAEVACVRAPTEGRRGVPLAVGMDDGLPDWSHRMRSLGNAVESDTAQLIMQVIELLSSGDSAT